MDLALELRNELNGMITKAEDIFELFPKWKDNKILLGVVMQCKFLIDILEKGSLCIYSYWHYIHEIHHREVHMKEGGKMAEGRIRATKFAHLCIDMDEVFKGFPTDREIADRMEVVAQQERDVMDGHTGVFATLNE